MERDHLNPIVGREYENLINAMVNAAEFNDLPVCMEITHPMSITLEDCRELAQWIAEDAGLDVSFQANMCPNCGELHLHMIVDYFDEDDEE
jgi:hypothetical protein